jgi:diguanylate cyclase (GGDEF)-like protein
MPLRNAVHDDWGCRHGRRLVLLGDRITVNAPGIPEPEGWEDPLTGLEGPDLWQRVLVTEVTRAVRYGRALTVVVAEVDGILEMGDQWGIEIARHSLREIAQCLRRLTRTSDYCMRTGLTRFGVVLTETNEIEAINFVERARTEAPLTLPRSGDGLRLAFGWASPKAGESAGSLVLRADRRLMQELANR